MTLSILTSFLLLFLQFTPLMEVNPCFNKKSKSEKIYTIDSGSVICKAKQSESDISLFYTFGYWCSPCFKKLTEAIRVAKEYQTPLSIILIDKEGSKLEEKAINYLNQQKIETGLEFDIYIIDDEGGRPRKKYEEFLTNITPDTLENISDMSKFIVINKTGEVLMITNWKDDVVEKGKDGKSDMIERKVVPFLIK